MIDRPTFFTDLRPDILVNPSEDNDGLCDEDGLSVCSPTNRSPQSLSPSLSFLNHWNNSHNHSHSHLGPVLGSSHDHGSSQQEENKTIIPASPIPLGADLCKLALDQQQASAYHRNNHTPLPNPTSTHNNNNIKANKVTFSDMGPPLARGHGYTQGLGLAPGQGLGASGSGLGRGSGGPGQGCGQLLFGQSNGQSSSSSSYSASASSSSSSSSSSSASSSSSSSSSTSLHASMDIMRGGSTQADRSIPEDHSVPDTFNSLSGSGTHGDTGSEKDQEKGSEQDQNQEKCRNCDNGRESGRENEREGGSEGGRESGRESAREPSVFMHEDNVSGNRSRGDSAGGESHGGSNSAGSSSSGCGSSSSSSSSSSSTSSTAPSGLETPQSNRHLCPTRTSGAVKERDWGETKWTLHMSPPVVLLYPNTHSHSNTHH